MRHNYVYYVHLQCFEPLFCQIGKDSLPSEISSEYMVMFEKAPRSYFSFLLFGVTTSSGGRDVFGDELCLLSFFVKVVSRFVSCRSVKSRHDLARSDDVNIGAGEML